MTSSTASRLLEITRPLDSCQFPNSTDSCCAGQSHSSACVSYCPGCRVIYGGWHTSWWHNGTPATRSRSGRRRLRYAAVKARRGCSRGTAYLSRTHGFLWIALKDSRPRFCEAFDHPCRERSGCVREKRSGRRPNHSAEDRSLRDGAQVPVMPLRTMPAARLALEAAAYLSFAVSVLQFFNPELIADRLSSSDRDASLPRRP